MKTINWFSCGAASAVMCKLFPADVIAYCDTGSENPDNQRILREYEKWLKQPIIILRSTKFKNVDDVVETRKYLSGFYGAPCTTELKKMPRLEFADIEDINCMGFTIEENKRAERLSHNSFELKFRYPLIANGVTKEQCYALIKNIGIEPPEMYKLGYDHNNCIGCVKSGSVKYWLMIKRDFPDVFKRRAIQERLIGYSLIKGIFLDELSGDIESASNEFDSAQCDLFCQQYQNDLMEHL